MENILIVRVDEMQIRAIIKEAIAEALSSTEAKYFNKKDAARYLKCSPVTLWSYERRGYINATKVGSRMMFLKGELDRFASGVKGFGK